MSQQLNPYLTFNGNCAEAMSFYGQALGAEPVLMTFRQSGMDVDGIMHASIASPAGHHIFASDHVEGMGEYTPGTNVQISLSGDDDEALRGYWDALSADGMVTIPLQAQIWGDTYGQFVDKFGIIWHINIAGAAAQA